MGLGWGRGVLLCTCMAPPPPLRRAHLLRGAAGDMYVTRYRKNIKWSDGLQWVDRRATNLKGAGGAVGRPALPMRPVPLPTPDADRLLCPSHACPHPACSGWPRGGAGSLQHHSRPHAAGTCVGVCIETRSSGERSWWAGPLVAAGQPTLPPTHPCCSAAPTTSCQVTAGAPPTCTWRTTSCQSMCSAAGARRARPARSDLRTRHKILPTPSSAGSQVAQQQTPAAARMRAGLIPRTVRLQHPFRPMVRWQRHGRCRASDSGAQVSSG